MFSAAVKARRAAAVTSLTVAALACASRPAAGEETFRVIGESASKPQVISGYDRWVLWTEQVPGTPAAASRFRTMLYEHGRGVRRVGAATVAGGDIDIGPGPNGRPMIVHTLRKRLHHGEDVYVYDVSTKTDRLVRGAASRLDERLPTIWRNRIAYFREDARHDEVATRPVQFRETRFGSSSSRSVKEAHVPVNASSYLGVDLYGNRTVLTYAEEAGDNSRPITWTCTSNPSCGMVALSRRRVHNDAELHRGDR